MFAFKAACWRFAVLRGGPYGATADRTADIIHYLPSLAVIFCAHPSNNRLPVAIALLKPRARAHIPTSICTVTPAPRRQGAPLSQVFVAAPLLPLRVPQTHTQLCLGCVQTDVGAE